MYNWSWMIIRNTCYVGDKGRREFNILKRDFSMTFQGIWLQHDKLLSPLPHRGHWNKRSAVSLNGRQGVEFHHISACSGNHWKKHHFRWEGGRSVDQIRAAVELLLLRGSHPLPVLNGPSLPRWLQSNQLYFTTMVAKNRKPTGKSPAAQTNRDRSPLVSPVGKSNARRAGRDSKAFNSSHPNGVSGIRHKLGLTPSAAAKLGFTLFLGELAC